MTMRPDQITFGHARFSERAASVHAAELGLVVAD